MAGKHISSLACLAASGLVGMGALAAPIDDFMVEGVSYDDAIPAPEEILGFGLGDRPVRHDVFVDYLEALAESSDRLSVETIGRTHEGRPILFLAATSPENHARLDQIKKDHLRGLRNGEAPAGDAPAVIWMNFGVHGAESAGMDAALPTLYHLAAAQGPEIEATLDDAVILAVAIINPDGHSRRADHVETFAGEVPVTDPAHAQHQLWTEARTNHYWFDLNRQWLLLTQPEAQAIVSKWHEWKPMVSADYHEMGSNSSYYFHPGEPKRLNPLIPDKARALAEGIAGYHRDAFDEEGRLYFSEQGFDNFYIGKGSTYPQVNGGLGILFEVGAARGGTIDTPAGERSYADNIEAHFLTALSTIAGTLALEDEIGGYQRDYFAGALEEAAEDPRRAFVFTAKGDDERTRRFAKLLRTHDIAVRQLAAPVTAGDVTYRPGEAYLVPMDQRQYRMVKGVFDRVTEFEEAVFYDVSGWTLPLAYDLSYAALGEGQDAAYDDALAGGLLRSVEEIEPAPTPQKASYGYAFDWSQSYAPRALHRLLDEDILVRIATEPFEILTEDGEVSLPRGAVFVPLARQSAGEETILGLMRTIAEEDGVTVHAAGSGAGEDLVNAVGGGDFEPVERPSVLLLFDEGLSRYEAGEAWHLLDHDMRIPVTMRRKDRLSALDWADYTHLILVGGNGTLASGHAERVAQWIEEGGTLIATQKSAVYAQDTFLESKEKSGLESTEEESREKEEKDEEASEDSRFDFARMREEDAEHVIGGAIVATDLDPTHPLGFGHHDRLLPVMRNTTHTLKAETDDPFATVAAYAPADELVLSGYVSQKRASELAGSPAVIAKSKGRGNVILLADDPVFRATFPGSARLLLNAVFFSDLIRAPRGDYTVEE